MAAIKKTKIINTIRSCSSMDNMTLIPGFKSFIKILNEYNLIIVGITQFNNIFIRIFQGDFYYENLFLTDKNTLTYDNLLKSFKNEDYNINYGFFNNFYNLSIAIGSDFILYKKKFIFW